MGWLLEQYGDLGGALRESEAALALARQHRPSRVDGGRPQHPRTGHPDCGAAARARPLHEEMLAITRELGTALWIAGALAELGEDLIALGDEAGGERHLHEAIEVAGEATQFVIPPCLALAELKLAQGRPREALDMARRAEDVAGGFLGWKLQARRLRGEALQALDAGAEGLALLRTTHAAGVATGFAPVVWTTALALADILGRRGQDVEAAAMRAELRTALEEVAAGLPDDLRLVLRDGPDGAARARDLSVRLSRVGGGEGHAGTDGTRASAAGPAARRSRPRRPAPRRAGG